VRPYADGYQKKRLFLNSAGGKKDRSFREGTGWGPCEAYQKKEHASSRSREHKKKKQICREKSAEEREIATTQEKSDGWNEDHVLIKRRAAPKTRQNHERTMRGETPYLQIE